MNGPVTLDASVFLNAYLSSEQGHDDSRRLMDLLQARGTPMICPSLLLPEVSATLSRGTRDPNLALEFTETLLKLPHLVIVSLDEQLGRESSRIAAEVYLRGSDAVYVATALRYATTLITLDQEMHDRPAALLTTHYPPEALSASPQL
jgi:predicted nucleic acid-binding protein